MVFAGQEYGTGSSRDWAAKGTSVAGVKAVVAAKLRTHPSLEPGGHGRAAAAIQGRAPSAQTLKLDGTESFDVLGLERESQAATGSHAAHHAQGRHGGEHSGQVPHRYPDRNRLLSARRHSAVCVAPVAGKPVDRCCDWGDSVGDVRLRIGQQHFNRAKLEFGFAIC